MSPTTTLSHRLFVAVALATACASCGPRPDSPHIDGGVIPGAHDAGTGAGDAGAQPDAGPPAIDAGQEPELDAGDGRDAGHIDAGSSTGEGGDAGAGVDGGDQPDSGAPEWDAGADSGSGRDGGQVSDAGTDAGMPSTCAVCASDAFCDADGGVAVCVCDRGFAGDGLTCDDIDECAATACGANAVCTNRRGSFDCVCASGFEGDAGVCSPIYARIGVEVTGLSGQGLGVASAAEAIAVVANGVHFFQSAWIAS